MKIVTEKHTIHMAFLCCLISIFCQMVHAQEQKTNLPSVYIYTNNNAPVESKKQYLSGRIIIKSTDPEEELDTITEIRGRGNSTWGFEKKPYRIKLDKKYNLLNLPAKARSWTLLANHADKTLIRNALASKISEKVGLEFSPSARFVDLVLNDQFLGNYMVSDQMQVHKHRVSIDELTHKDTDQESITGGYLLEIDGLAAEEPEWFATRHKDLKITIKSPDADEITSEQRRYIIDFVNDFEQRLFSADFTDSLKGYRAKVDTLSLINWYIGCELTGNPDSFWSTYIYKKRGIDKLFFGPMWDYDIAFNNDDRLQDATRKLMREYAHPPRTWIEQLAQDSWFCDAVWRRWSELLQDDLLEELCYYIDELAWLIDDSQRENFRLWGGVRKKVYREQYLFRTYDQGVEYLKDYLSERIDFLTAEFQDARPPKPSETFVADPDAYYMIMNRKSKNVIHIAENAGQENAPLVTWEPKIDNDSQLWAIVSAGNDTYHFINKQSGLAITGNGRENSLTQKSVTNQASQHWKVVPVNTGNVYCLVNAASDHSMNNSGGGTENGTPVIEYDKGITFNGEYNIVESENRQWYLQKMKVNTVNYREAHLSGASHLRVYPNPATHYIYVELGEAMGANVSIQIHTLLGKEVYKENVHITQQENTFAIETQHFESGVYLLTLLTEKGEHFTRKIMIKER